MASITKHARDVVIAPVVSEKTYGQLESGTYTFRIHADAHKTMVRQAVEEIWGVKVADVRIVNVRPKPKRRGVYRGTRSGYKKAIVQLAPGHSIALFEGMAG